MNRFEKQSRLVGAMNAEEFPVSLCSLFCFAGEIREMLNEKAYLLDSYLSLFFEATGRIICYDAAERGFQWGQELRGLCSAVLTGDTDETHFFYTRACATLRNHTAASGFQEHATRLEFFNVCLTDEYFSLAVDAYYQEVESALDEIYDHLKITTLYRKLAGLVGEETMEKLNTKLEGRFLLATPVTIFMQSFNSQLLHSLTYRDDESNRQIFQLYMETVSKEKAPAQMSAEENKPCRN